MLINRRVVYMRRESGGVVLLRDQAAPSSVPPHPHPNATTSAPGFMSQTDKQKLDGVASGATANASDAQLRDRATHTGTQPLSSIEQSGAAVGQVPKWTVGGWVPGDVAAVPGGTTGQLQYHGAGGTFAGAPIVYNSGSGLTSYTNPVRLPAGNASSPAIGKDDSGLIFDNGIDGAVQVVSNSSSVAILASNGNQFPTQTTFRRRVSSMGFSTEVGPNLRALMTNRGATGLVTWTLNQYFFLDGTEFEALRIEPHAVRLVGLLGTERFLRADGSLTAAGKYIELGSVGALLRVCWDGTHWLCLSERGTINVEP
ncbi:hypothetical protein [Ahniella affigens]|uniref:hypothetical protein n=1 Tax=Ahniella affigens TaxID=2021234 RepID=UPI0011B28CA5|nr:hypothetical protein [Ahniella affigens]